MALKRFLLFGLLFTVIINCIYYKQYLVEPWIKHSLTNSAVIITLSTTPHRIANIKPTIDSLLQQKLPVPIYLNIPYTFKRNNTEYIIPAWLQNYPGVNIVRCNDYGPATKVLGLLEKINLDPETIIISVDDDVVYPKNLTLHLAAEAKKYPNSAIGIVGANFDYDAPWHIAPNSIYGLIDISSPHKKVAALKGYGGVAYKRKFFNNNIFKFVTAAKPCLNNDDLLFSYNLAAQKIERYVLRNDYINPQNIWWQREIGNSQDALHLLERPVDKHRACLAYLYQLDPNLVF